jgi:hypothetical protein
MSSPVVVKDVVILRLEAWVRQQKTPAGDFVSCRGWE